VESVHLAAASAGALAETVRALTPALCASPHAVPSEWRYSVVGVPGGVMVSPKFD
jgi:hypothetical protein